MAKVWAFLKVTVLIWGFFSLVIVLFFVAMIIASNIRSKEVIDVEREHLNKIFGDINLRVTRDYGEDTSMLIDISKGTKPLTTKYRLPMKEYGLHGVTVTDASVFPVNEGEYRVILYSATHDCDRQSGQYIWFFKWRDQLSLVAMISLSNLYKVGGKESVMIGNKSIFLPSFEAFNYAQTAIPIEVQVGNVIKVRPMLDRRSIDLIRASFGKEVDARIEVLMGSKNSELLDVYRKANRELNETLSERTYAF